MNPEQNPWGITREEVLNLAADKLLAAYDGRHDTDDGSEYSLHESLLTRLEKMISASLKETMAKEYPKGMGNIIEARLTEEMERIINTEYVPVNLWGEREGKPTSIRASILERARVYWDTKVSADGRPSDYGGKPRHEHLFAKLVEEEFAKAVSQNITNIVGALKDALKADAVKTVTEHIDKIIKVKTS